MQFHVAQNGEKSGPYDRDEVYRRLVAGELKPTDLGWHEGLNEWEPLSKLIPPQTPPIPAPVSPVFGPATVQGSQAVVTSQNTSGLAIASLICGILGFVTLGLAGLPAVITGHLSLSQIKKSAGALGGKGMAIAGLIMGYLGFGIIFIAIFASMAVPAFTVAQVRGNQMKAVNNARQLVISMRQYALDHDGSLPPTLEALYQENLLTDRRLLEVPGTPVKTTPETAWEYRGAGMKDSSGSSSIVLISRESYRREERITAKLDGSAEVTKNAR